jgi:hypothetical protein
MTTETSGRMGGRSDAQCRFKYFGVSAAPRSTDVAARRGVYGQDVRLVAPLLGGWSWVRHVGAVGGCAGERDVVLSVSAPATRLRRRRRMLDPLARASRRVLRTTRNGRAQGWLPAAPARGFTAERVARRSACAAQCGSALPTGSCCFEASQQNQKRGHRPPGRRCGRTAVVLGAKIAPAFGEERAWAQHMYVSRRWRLLPAP